MESLHVAVEEGGAVVTLDGWGLGSEAVEATASLPRPDGRTGNRVLVVLQPLALPIPISNIEVKERVRLTPVETDLSTDRENNRNAKIVFRRFWFEFDLKISDPHPSGTLLGCGVTAVDYDDALYLLAELVFKKLSLPVPKITHCIEDIDISMLDSNHVIPSMGNIFLRGVWFPLGFDEVR